MLKTGLMMLKIQLCHYRNTFLISGSLRLFHDANLLSRTAENRAMSRFREFFKKIKSCRTILNDILYM